MTDKLTQEQMKIWDCVVVKLGRPTDLYQIKIVNIPKTTNYRVDIWVEEKVEGSSLPERKVGHSYFINWDGKNITYSNPPIEKRYADGKKIELPKVTKTWKDPMVL